jgi:hypothetical protein
MNKRVFKIGKHTLTVPEHRFRTVESDEDNRIVCPKCHGEHVHHGAVIVFVREREDGATRATLVDERGVDTLAGLDWAAPQNPSSRNGVLIRFWCETCSACFALTLAQHKGTTLLEWQLSEPFQAREGSQ